MARVKWLSGDRAGEEDSLGFHELQSALEAGAVEVLPDDPEKDPTVLRVTVAVPPEDDQTAEAKAPGGGEVKTDPQHITRHRRRE